MPNLAKLANDKRIVVKLPIEKKIMFNTRKDELGMSASQFLIYLLNEYDGNNLSVIKNFRRNLNRRIKKGIDRNYMYELKELRNQLNIIIDRL